MAGGTYLLKDYTINLVVNLNLFNDVEVGKTSICVSHLRLGFRVRVRV